MKFLSIFKSADDAPTQGPLGDIFNRARKQETQRAEFLLAIAHKMAVGDDLAENEKDELAALLVAGVISQEELTSMASHAKAFEAAVSRYCQDVVAANNLKVDTATVTKRRDELQSELNRINAALAAQDKAIVRANNSRGTVDSVINTNREFFAHIDLKDYLSKRVKTAADVKAG